jgi:putative membrane protein
MDPLRCGFNRCGPGFAGGHRGWDWFGFVDSIALWLLAAAAILLIVRLLRRGGPGRWRATAPAPVAGWSAQGAPPPPGYPHLAQAEATLADRFARGEIQADEYQYHLAVLRGQVPAGPTPTVAESLSQGVPGVQGGQGVPPEAGPQA